jgi:hypothetical protein
MPFGGTSAATPAAAAIAALMLQINPTLTPAQIGQILQQTATQFGNPLVAGAGLVNALAAVTAALPPPPNAPPAGTTANMVLSNAGGLYNIYNIGGNSVLASNQLGLVGTDWAFVTLGGFNDGDTSDMLLRNSTSGGFQVYDIADNNIYGSASLGNVGLNWQVMGFGNFSSLGSSVPGETDLLLRDMNTGGLQVYDINNNQITGSALIGKVGLDWQYAGVAAANGAGTSDLVLRNVNSGTFAVYDIANNQVTGTALLGQVGANWQVGGFAAASPTGSMGSSDNSTAQLVQAMAGFGSGAAESLNTVPLGADISQQTFLTAPQHA